jgi:hypothetical protein
VQAVTDADAAAVGRLGTPVIVVDGRPRYHVADCLHVLGRSVQRVPVREAAVIGFTPCALCEPVTRSCARSVVPERLEFASAAADAARYARAHGPRRPTVGRCLNDACPGPR